MHSFFWNLTIHCKTSRWQKMLRNRLYLTAKDLAPGHSDGSSPLWEWMNSWLFSPQMWKWRETVFLPNIMKNASDELLVKAGSNWDLCEGVSAFLQHPLCEDAGFTNVYQVFHNLENRMEFMQKEVTVHTCNALMTSRGTEHRHNLVVPGHWERNQMSDR